MANLGAREQDFILRYGHLCRKQDLMTLFNCSKRQIDTLKKKLKVTQPDSSCNRAKKLHYKQIEYMFNNNVDEIVTNIDFRSRKVVIPTHTSRVWSQLEEDYLLDYFGIKPTDELCRNLNRTRSSVYFKARQLYLKAIDNVGKIPLYTAARKYNLSIYSLIKAIQICVIEEEEYTELPSERIGRFIYLAIEDLDLYISKKHSQMMFFCDGCNNRHLVGTIICRN